MPGPDILVDGAFMGNTPLEMALDEGVREVTLSQSGRKLWSNRLRVKKDVVISPELVFE